VGTTRKGHQPLRAVQPTRPAAVIVIRPATGVCHWPARTATCLVGLGRSPAGPPARDRDL